MATKKPAGDTRLDLIERIRTRLAAIEVERDEVERAPLPPAEIEARAGEIVDRLASFAGAKTIAAYMIAPQRPGSVRLVQSVVSALAQPDRAAGQESVPAGALLAAMDRDGMVAWLTRIAAAEAGGHPPALPAAERAQRLQILDGERADLERDEASACWETENLGGATPWRADMRPELVLGMEE